MPDELENDAAAAAAEEGSVSSSGTQAAPPPPSSGVKKKRNLPGMPDPGAEVVALSPKTLMATNRFVCEICSKGFQRDQNLQLHRRGHNLPWKLRQRTSKEVRKKVYVCPEVSCVHHDPTRALGDLTGIKKHFCRKHGEKKWKCEKCSKNYAVQSDWKAHSKVCGTKEYKCDCGTTFSRRDSFVTHRAFCDVLTDDRIRAARTRSPDKNVEDGSNPNGEVEPEVEIPTIMPPSSPSAAPAADSHANGVGSVLPIQDSELNWEESGSPEQVLEHAQPVTAPCIFGSSTGSTSSNSNGSATNGIFGSLFAPSSASTSIQNQAPGFANLFWDITTPEGITKLAPSLPTEPISLCLSTNHSSSIFRPTGEEPQAYASQPVMSATALLQKAAQMGPSSSGSSLLRGLGVVSSLPSSSIQREVLDWNGMQIGSGNTSFQSSLGLGLQYDEGSRFNELMMGNSSIFEPKPTTLDFLGLGMAAGGGGSTGSLSALITSIEGGLDVAAAAASYGNAGDFSRKDIGRSS
ncbi:unnamed protein product [Rhodiola kirilowii]